MAEDVLNFDVSKHNMTSINLIDVQETLSGM